MSIRVEMLDLGINNLASLRRALTDAGARELRVVASGNESHGADLMVLPGVGAFGAAVDELKQRGLDETVKHHVAGGGYLMGVCLGMQLLTTTSEESPGAAGLDLIHGEVRRLVPNAGQRVPNMGWGGALTSRESEDFPGLGHPVDYYFVHSYAVVPDDANDILSTSTFGAETFVSGLLHDNIVGVQFHPEKSSRPGAELLKEVLRWADG